MSLGTLAALAPSYPSVCRVRSIGESKLGNEGGMALAEALMRNTTLEYLGSAALHSPMLNLMLPCTSHPSSFLRCLSRTPAPACTLIATGRSLLAPGLAPRAAQPLHPLHTQRARR